MQIECTLKRKGGSFVTLEDVEYAFLPLDPENPRSPQVANVESSKHLKRFLSIEGYEIFDDDEELPVDAAEDDTQDSSTSQDGRGMKPEALSGGTAPIQPQDGSATDPEPTETPEPASAPEPTPEPVTEAGDDLDELSEDALRERHEQVTGRKPHHKAKPETMIAAIRAAQSERGQ